MSAVQYNFDIVQGDNLNLTLTATGVNGSAINLNGYSLYAGIKSRFGASGYLENITAASISGEQGIFSLTMPATGTAALYVQRAVYDVKMVSGNTTTQIFKGYANVLPEVY